MDLSVNLTVCRNPKITPSGTLINHHRFIRFNRALLSLLSIAISYNYQFMIVSSLVLEEEEEEV